MNQKPYLYGDPKTRIYPLQDHLPPYQKGVVSSWLTETLPPGSQILCPFGSSPQVALEAAQAGYRVLLPVHNPVLRFLIENLTNPLSREDLNSALVTLASSYKGEERLKPFILSLYETDCPLCGMKTPAAAFQWSKSNRELISKTCRCSECGEESIEDASVEDIDKANGFSHRSPTYARALTRVTSPTDTIRLQVENALATYPPRSVYALFTILNKLTGFDLPEEQLRAIEILLLHAFYRCSQPLAMLSSEEQDQNEENGTYLEENVWFAMQDALEIWPSESPSLPVTTWPELPPQNGGICVYPGRVKELIPLLEDRQVEAMVMVFPRPTPAFWGLSALWTGWLWGQEAAAPLRGVLSVRKYDWPWMTRAVEITLKELSLVLPEPTPILGLIPDADIPSLISSSLAGLRADIELENLAVDPDQKFVQTRWQYQPQKRQNDSGSNPRELIRQAGLDLLKEAGEPLPSLTIYGAGLSRLAKEGFPGLADHSRPEDSYSRLLVDFEENIAYRQGYLHYPGIENWWHLDLEPSEAPHSDRIEKFLVTSLVKAGNPIKESDLLGMLYREFPGLLTPRSNLIKNCLRSYAQHPDDDPRYWVLKASDTPASRIADLEEMEHILTNLGSGLGFKVERATRPDSIHHLTWQEQGINTDSFFISPSALLSKILTAPQSESMRYWLILPGSRAELIHYKFRQNPILADRIADNWGLIKFRHLRQLAQQGDINRANFQERFQLDPFTSHSPQPLLI